ncbi:MAG TPA: efflux RND transporter periplasmic adaptor subunit [Bacteroidales bacterium]|nr:efflux RND transporter periplasmic adaptor subunit [Bacteroidales bacterium]
MKNKNFKYINYILFLLAGIILGWIVFHSSGKHNAEPAHVASSDEIWTCSMHPQIRMHEPGKCPICGMNLIPLEHNDEAYDSLAVYLTPEAAQLANVMTSKVTRQNPVMEVRLYGKVQADERMIQSQTAHIPGRIEDLLVSFTGEAVKKGQALVVLYSPELITAQQELIEASRTRQSQPEIYQAAREKLMHWKLSDEQIDGILQSGMTMHDFKVTSNTSGIVTRKFVNNGDHVAEGTPLYEVADLSRVWVMFDAYETDLLFLKPGDVVSFFIQALPGMNFSGKIEFIDPVIDPVTRVAKVRVEYNNAKGLLKPEMFATGLIKTNAGYHGKDLVIPKSAVLWTGTRSIVYVKKPGTEPVFSMREVTLGPVVGNSYVITAGLKEGEEIVTQGTFSVDAAAQLDGKPSMMSQ